MPHAYSVAVRYGLMMHTERFGADEESLRPGDEVILRTARGIEVGVASAKPVPAGDGGDGAGEVLRRLRPDDRSVLRHIHDTREPEAFRVGRERIHEHGLEMRLVGVEHLFGGEKLIFYFIADGRVDFRALVKDLARRFRTRIEMRQIGVRDEARLLADHEHCGRELCCRTFIRNLEPVTMRMAKTQKTTLDPTKISGHCGRLMCCLRFEDATYASLQAEMPPRGATVKTERLSGEVVGGDVLKQEVVLLLPDGTRETVRRADIVELRPRFRSRPEENGGQRPAASRRDVRERRPDGRRRGAGETAAAEAPDENLPEVPSIKTDDV